MKQSITIALSTLILSPLSFAQISLDDFQISVKPSAVKVLTEKPSEFFAAKSYQNVKKEIGSQVWLNNYQDNEDDDETEYARQQVAAKFDTKAGTIQLVKNTTLSFEDMPEGTSDLSKELLAKYSSAVFVSKAKLSGCDFGAKPRKGKAVIWEDPKKSKITTNVLEVTCKSAETITYPNDRLSLVDSRVVIEKQTEMHAGPIELEVSVTSSQKLLGKKELYLRINKGLEYFLGRTSSYSLY